MGGRILLLCYQWEHGYFFQYHTMGGKAAGGTFPCIWILLCYQWEDGWWHRISWHIPRAAVERPGAKPAYTTDCEGKKEEKNNPAYCFFFTFCAGVCVQNDQLPRAVGACQRNPFDWQYWKSKNCAHSGGKPRLLLILGLNPNPNPKRPCLVKKKLMETKFENRGFDGKPRF